MRTKRLALLAGTLLTLVLGGGVVVKLTEPPIPNSLCGTSLGGAGAFSPSDPTIYTLGPTGVADYTPAQVAAVSAYVARRWHLPLAVVDSEAWAPAFPGPWHHTAALLFDPGAVASTPTACLHDVAASWQDAANFVPPHAPTVVVAVDITSTETQTGTLLGPRTVTVTGDPALLRAHDQAALEALAGGGLATR